MNRKLIKGIALTLTAVLVTGCTASNANSMSNGDGSQYEEINVMIWDRGDSAPGTTVENNALTEFVQESVLEEKGVKVNYTSVTRSGSDDQLNVMMAGGSAPDVILTYERPLFGDYAVKGGLADLGPSIEKYGSNLQEELGDILEVGVIDGTQYAIPARRNTQKVKHVAYIRKDWVDAVGMELPTTKDELIEVLYAFQEHDPGNVGSALVPWAMGGNADSEKYYLNFVGSYARTDVEQDEYVYIDHMKAVQPGAEEGFKVLNQLYNDGIISKDFAVDTNDDKYRQDITNGNVGFFVDDAMRPIDSNWLDTLAQNDPTAEFVPIVTFENPDGEYVIPGDPLYGMYIMVPKTSQDKADAVVKYLDWLAVTENAMNVFYSPGYEVGENGVPISLSESELQAMGYAGTPNDYTIVTQFWDYHDDKDKVVAEWDDRFPGYGEEYLGDAYDVYKTGIYNPPVLQEVLEAETRYMPSVKKLMIEFSYKVMSAPAAEFDSVYAAEYAKLEQAGLTQIIEEREAYYNNNIAK